MVGRNRAGLGRIRRVMRRSWGLGELDQGGLGRITGEF
jgi:hypothetical protein